MSVTESDPKLLPQVVLNLRDRLQHGQHVTRILESQLETAQQNISLLQGQVRLANETIANLKKHFRETENIISGFLSGDVTSFHGGSGSPSDGHKSPLDCPVPDNNNSKNSIANVDSTTHSPRPDCSADRSRHINDKTESAKSPFAQQLRQVLDVLDEEPRKTVYVHHPEATSKTSSSCSCSDCQTGHKKQFMEMNKECGYGSSSCDSHHFHSHHDNFRKNKQHVNGHVLAQGHDGKSFVSGRSDSVGNHSPYGAHCTGPCCTSTDNHHNSYKITEKGSSGPVHYVSVHSPMVHMGETIMKHEPGHHHHLPGHCGDKCQCQAFVNYAPYGYHIVESAPGVPESIQPISPTSRRKRTHLPLMPGEEPPHLKYTKVKRIDGSKLSAQKTLQDFTKRRYLPYNPRFDLDLLIVPPPIPAIDLMKGSSQSEADSAVLAKYSAETVMNKYPIQVSQPVVQIVNSVAHGQSSAVNGKQSMTSVGSYGFKSPVSILPIIKEERVDVSMDDHSVNEIAQINTSNSSSTNSGSPEAMPTVESAYHVGDRTENGLPSSHEVVVPVGH